MTAMPLRVLLAQPDFAVVLVLAGVLLLYVEFNRPGSVVPGAVGMLAAMLGVYGLGMHALGVEGLQLLAAGLASLAAAVFLHRQMLVAAIVFLYAGLLRLIPDRAPDRPISLITALAVASIFTAVTYKLGCIALRARRNKRIPSGTLTSHPPEAAAE